MFFLVKIDLLVFYNTQRQQEGTNLDQIKNSRFLSFIHYGANNYLVNQFVKYLPF